MTPRLFVGGDHMRTLPITFYVIEKTKFIPYSVIAKNECDVAIYVVKKLLKTLIALRK